jgi:hypothetical protein
MTDACLDSAAPANSHSPEVGFFQDKPATGRHRGRHLVQRHNGLGEMGQDEAAVHEVLGTGLQIPNRDVMLAHFDRVGEAAEARRN